MIDDAAAKAELVAELKLDQAVFELTQVVTYEEHTTVTRETALELLAEHDPEARGLEELPDEYLMTMLAATLNDYPDSAIHAYFIENAVGGDILNSGPWSGRVARRRKPAEVHKG